MRTVAVCCSRSRWTQKQFFMSLSFFWQGPHTRNVSKRRGGPRVCPWTVTFHLPLRVPDLWAQRRVKANQYKVFPIYRLYPAVKQNDDLNKSEVTLWPLQSQLVLTPVGNFPSKRFIALSYQNTKYLLEERRAPLEERPRDLENQCQGAARLLANTNTAINSTGTFIFSTRKFTPAVYVQL